MPDNIINENTREINGQLYSWQPSNALQELMDYLGLTKEQAAQQMGLSDEQLADYDKPDVGQGSWVPSSYKNEKGTFGPKWLLPAMIGGPALAAGIGGLAGGAAAGAAGGGGTAASVAPTVGGAAGGGGGAGGILSALGIGGGGGVGGTTGSILSGLGTAGQIAGKISEGRAAGRQAEAQNAALNNQMDLQRANAAQNAGLDAAQLDLARKNFSIDAPTRRAGQVSLGDLLAGLQDVHLNIAGVDPSAYSVAGGLRPSLLGDMSRQAGGELSKQALAALLNKTDTTFDPLPKFDLPEKMTAPQPGKMDKALNILGTVGSFAGLAKGFAKPTGGIAPTAQPSVYSPSAGGLGKTITMPSGTFNPRRFV